MCQIASVNRSGSFDDEFLPPKTTPTGRPPLFLRSRMMKGSMDIRLCPVLRKYSEMKEDLPDNVLLEPPDHLMNMGSGTEHLCFICAQFQQNNSSEPTSRTNLKENVTSFFSVLRRSTQPIHLAAMVIVIALAMFFDRFRRSSLIFFEIHSAGRTMWPLIYLSSFSVLFGAQMWMTFVSGLVLLFILPRHTFACVQSALFPKYMILNGVAATVALVGYIQTKQSWSFQEDYQIVGLVINSICPLVTRIIVVPSLLLRIKDKMTMERVAGHGPEAGPKLAQLTASLLNRCPTYKRACFRFRQLHGIVAAVNVITLACNAFHLYYLASKIAFNH